MFVFVSTPKLVMGTIKDTSKFKGTVVESAGASKQCMYWRHVQRRTEGTAAARYVPVQGSLAHLLGHYS